MKLPELVEDALGDERVVRSVSLGDEDVLCITPTRTLLYRSEGLISDESVTEYPHDVDRLRMSEGRRKTKFVLEYVGSNQSLSVSPKQAREVLTALTQGILAVDGVLDGDESVVGAFRFSELTLIIAERRVVKHVGSTVWDEDYETFDYDDLTGLDFEQLGGAKEVVLELSGRPQRIKTPNDQARYVEQTVKKAVFNYFDVTSLNELNERIAPADEEESDPDVEDDSRDELGLGDDFDSLVGGTSDDPGPFDDPLESDGEPEQSATDDPAAGEDAVQANTAASQPDRQQARQGQGQSAHDPASRADQSVEQPPSQEDRSSQESTSQHDRTAPTQSVPSDVATQEEVDAVTDQLADLTEAVNRQNELLKKQHAAMKQLITELRQERD